MTTISERPPYCKCAFTDPDGTFVPGEACQVHPGVVPRREALTSNLVLEAVRIFIRNRRRVASNPTDSPSAYAHEMAILAQLEAVVLDAERRTPVETTPVISETAEISEEAWKSLKPGALQFVRATELFDHYPVGTLFQKKADGRILAMTPDGATLQARAPLEPTPKEVELFDGESHIHRRSESTPKASAPCSYCFGDKTVSMSDGSKRMCELCGGTGRVEVKAAAPQVVGVDLANGPDVTVEYCPVCYGRDGEHQKGCVDGDAPL